MSRKRRQGEHRSHQDYVRRASVGPQIVDASATLRAMTVRSLLPNLTGGTPLVKPKKIRKPPEPWEFTDENPYD